MVDHARQENPARDVALKVIHPARFSQDAIRRFAHEARVLGRLQHSGIAQIFESGVAKAGSDDQPYLVMEFVVGAPLTEYAKAKTLDLGARLRLMIAVCDAVQHAHQKGVIHRDLKPGNILVDEAGQRLRSGDPAVARQGAIATRSD